MKGGARVVLSEGVGLGRQAQLEFLGLLKTQGGFDNAQPRANGVQREPRPSPPIVARDISLSNYIAPRASVV